MSKQKLSPRWLIAVSCPLLVGGVLLWSRHNAISSTPEMVPLNASLSTGQPAVMKWDSDLSSALKTAQSTDKLIMIEFYTDECSICRWMDANTYKDPGVIQEANNFVPVKLNANKNLKLAVMANIEAFPTIIWLDKEGKERKRIVGKYEASELITEMQAARS